MNCPKCKNTALVDFKVDDVIVDRCPSCEGMWFDADELVQLLAEDAAQVAGLRRGNLQDGLDEKRGACPRDGGGLLRVYSAVDRSVVIDACPECRGIWLDGGEFAKLFTARRI